MRRPFGLKFSEPNSIASVLPTPHLYQPVCGRFFTTAGGSTAKRVANRDGNAWSALGVEINNVVYALALSGTELYAAGGFTWADGPANYIAKWDGSAWSALGSGVNSVVYALAVSGSDLYAGGRLTPWGKGQQGLRPCRPSDDWHGWRPVQQSGVFAGDRLQLHLLRRDARGTLPHPGFFLAGRWQLD